jgi:hypothetical protein
MDSGERSNGDQKVRQAYQALDLCRDRRFPLTRFTNHTQVIIVVCPERKNTRQNVVFCPMF